MITQHLLLRCKRGAFDTDTAITGFKTAAVSGNASELRHLTRFQNLMETVRQRGSLPDDLKLPRMAASANVYDNMNAPRPRGILRISKSQGLSIVGRSFRVNDMCDNRGIVTFTHSFILQGEEREQFLRQPEAMLNLDNYDSYQQVAVRCPGGLNSGNPVTVNEELNIFRSPCERVSHEIFQYCGFTENTFSALMTAICDRVFAQGKVVLTMPKITSGDWNQYGGSLLGEQLLAAIYTILPECVSSQLGGVSYWSGQSSVSELEGIQLLIVPEPGNEMVNSSSISLIDLGKDRFTNVSRNRLMGRHLWKSIANQQSLEEFDRYLNYFFGKNADKIRKTSAIMELVTNLFLQKKKGYPDDPERLILATAKVFGKYFEQYPEVNGEFAKLLAREKQKGCHSKELEEVLLQQVRMDHAATLPAYQEAIYCLLQNVDKDQASKETIQTLTELLQGEDAVVKSQLVEYLSNVRSQRDVHQSDALLKLIASIYNARGDGSQENVRSLAAEILLSIYPGLYKASNWKRCFVILQIRAECLSQENISGQELQGVYAQLLSLWFVCDQETRAQLTALLTEEETRIYTRFPARTATFWNCFGNALEKGGVNHFTEDMCKCFLLLLPLVFGNDSAKEQWGKCFRALLKRIPAQHWDEAEQCIPALKGRNSCSPELMFIATIKLEMGVWQPCGSELARRLDQFGDQRLGERLKLVQLALTRKQTNSERRELIEQMVGSVYYYAFFFSTANNGSADNGMAQSVLARPAWWKELLQNADSIIVENQKCRETLPRVYVQLLQTWLAQSGNPPRNWSEALVALSAEHIDQCKDMKLANIPRVEELLLPEVRKVLEQRAGEDCGQAEMIDMDPELLKKLHQWYTDFQWQGKTAELVGMCRAVDCASSPDDVAKVCRRLSELPPTLQTAIMQRRIEHGRIHSARGDIIERELNRSSQPIMEGYSAMCMVATAIHYAKEGKDALEAYFRMCFGNYSVNDTTRLVYLLLGYTFAETMNRTLWNEYKAAYERAAQVFFCQVMGSNADACLDEELVRLYNSLTLDAEMKRKLSIQANNTGVKKLMQVYSGGYVADRVEFSVIRLLLCLLVYTGVIGVAWAAHIAMKAVLGINPVAALVMAIVLFALSFAADVTLVLKMRN